MQWMKEIWYQTESQEMLDMEGKTELVLQLIVLIRTRERSVAQQVCSQHRGW